MKKYRYILITTLAALFLSACSEGGDASFKDGITNISLASYPCQTPVDLSSYAALQSGDTVVKEDANAEVIIYHDVNNTKKICLVNGSAHIIRGN